MDNEEQVYKLKQYCNALCRGQGVCGGAAGGGWVVRVVQDGERGAGGEGVQEGSRNHCVPTV